MKITPYSVQGKKQTAMLEHPPYSVIWSHVIFCVPETKNIGAASL
jgi:hypothetical protein